MIFIIDFYSKFYSLFFLQRDKNRKFMFFYGYLYIFFFRAFKGSTSVLSTDIPWAKGLYSS